MGLGLAEKLELSRGKPFRGNFGGIPGDFPKTPYFQRWGKNSPQRAFGPRGYPLRNPPEGETWGPSNTFLGGILWPPLGTPRP